MSQGVTQEQEPLFVVDGGARFEIKVHPHIEFGGNDSFSPYVEGSRVPVRRLWGSHKRGIPIATLIARYPTLGPARILSALAFAYDNEALIEYDLARSETEGAKP